MTTESTDDAAFMLELRRLPYDKRWNLLKPRLESLFHNEDVEHISKILKQRWGFDATPRQCKHRFKSWGWRKNIPEKVQQDVCVKALKRAARGKETLALYQGQPIPPQRLHRTLKASASSATNSQPFSMLAFSLPADQYDILGGYLPFGNSLLVNWRLPYGSRPSDPTDSAKVWTCGSPASSIQTPNDVEIRTPAATNGDSPGSMARLQNQASLTPIVRQQRSSMLLDGRLHDLLRTLSPPEQMALSTWLYQFWYAGFVAAQTWDRTPLPRTNESPNLENQQFGPSNLASNALSGPFVPQTRSEVFEISMPSHQCRWTFHVRPYSYKPVDRNENSDFYMAGHDQLTQLDEQSFSRHLHKNLQSNEFSNIPEARLPVPVPEVARQITRHPSELALESVAFAIMGRNVDLLFQTLRNLAKQNIDVAPIYPFHMAAAFLDGGSACCLVFDALFSDIKGAAVTKERLVNEYGHTVLDGFLLTILRSHTTVSMKDVDGTLGDNATMPGQEVDICGRWSADSQCFQTFVASGRSTLPDTWKHKFCHTSIQAVIHSTLRLLGEYPTTLDMPSGLFKQQCFDCGQRLQLGPLHALVMTSFCLATAGTAEEDLFGVVAYYLALVAAGVPPLNRCPISPLRIFSVSSDVACTHEEMTPYEMAVAIESQISWSSLPEGIRTGWMVFTTIMQIAEDACSKASAAREPAYDEYGDSMLDLESLALNVWTDDCAEDTDSQSQGSRHQRQEFSAHCGEDCDHIYDLSQPWFGDSSILGHVWAAIQAELANHRKVGETDGWLSESFSMKALLVSLKRGGRPDIGYIRQSVLLPYCRCGKFEQSFSGVVLREDIFEEHTANFDGSAETWARSSFVDIPRVWDYM